MGCRADFVSLKYFKLLILQRNSVFSIFEAFLMQLLTNWLFSSVLTLKLIIKIHM